MCATPVMNHRVGPQRRSQQRRTAIFVVRALAHR
jgi:hypothetical protein